MMFCIVMLILISMIVLHNQINAHQISRHKSKHKSMLINA